ncbi:MAG TPA: hypothetical protein VGI26_03340 [Solirubrobacteraceae bacterium]|jgi:hypothetical protein
MATTDSSNSGSDTPVVEGGVLAALPRTRPQRASARRAVAREKGPKSETAGARPATRKTGKARPGNVKAAGAPAATTKPKAGERSVAKAKPTTAKPKRATTPTKRPPAARATRQSQAAKPVEPPAPKQGYEAEEELELGSTVNPPSGVELLESLGDIVSELAGSSLTAGGRLLKDAISILRRP